MSTRCQIHVDQAGLGWTQEVMLFRHYDGYPDAVIPDLVAAWEGAPKGWEAGRAGKAAAAIIRGVAHAEPEAGLELHRDIEYLYRVTCQNERGGSIEERAYWMVRVFNAAGRASGPPDVGHLLVQFELGRGAVDVDALVAVASAELEKLYP